jgi:hypothetical protein
MQDNRARAFLMWSQPVENGREESEQVEKRRKIWTKNLHGK